MLSLGALGLTGAVTYGGVKALRRLLGTASRPPWLQAAQPVAVAVTASGETVTMPVDLTMAAEPANRAAAMLNYVVQDEQGRKLSIIALSGTTAALHLLLGVQAGVPLFIWNGVGFVAFAAGQYFIPQLAPYRREVRDGFLAYTGTTVVAYFLVNGVGGLTSVVGMTTKLVEAGLIALLWNEAEAE